MSSDHFPLLAVLEITEPFIIISKGKIASGLCKKLDVARVIVHMKAKADTILF